MALSKPSSRERTNNNVKIGELAEQDALVVVRFIEDKPEMQTVNGVTDAVAVDLLVVDGAHADTYEPDRLIFNSGVVNVVTGADKGEVFAGRIVWKTTKTGRKAAILSDCTEADEAVAEAAWDAKQAEQSQPKQEEPAPF